MLTLVHSAFALGDRESFRSRTEDSVCTLIGYELNMKPSHMPAWIHPPFEAFYILAMQWHTTSAARSIEVLQSWLKLVDAEDERAFDLPKDDLFGELQNILHQFGCISRYFFPARRTPIYTGRAAQLRQAFAVPDDSPLANRELRNAMEHFDERLDEYLAGHVVGQIVPDHVGYSISVSDAPFHVFKGFYVGNLTFVLLGEEHDMRPIIAELVRLHNLLIDCQEGGLRLPR